MSAYDVPDPFGISDYIVYLSGTHRVGYKHTIALVK